MRFAVMLAVLSASVSACATVAQPDRDQINDAIRARTGHEIAADRETRPLPPDVSLDDGVTEREAVATALWNSPSFRATLADLGVARAELVDAGLLRNPILSLLFPVGPKQLEWTLQFPVEVFWQRPRRVAAAGLNMRSVAERLVYDALAQVAAVRTAFIDAVNAGRRLTLAMENARLTRRIADISDARLRAGDISELESRSARNDAAQADATVRAIEHDREASIVALLTLMGVDRDARPLSPVGSDRRALTTCGDADAMVKDALASRPDVRAAEIAIEAAGQRASLERARVVNLIATLDANGEGREGYELGPGLAADLPIFSRNQGAISRALAEMERAAQTYLAVKLRVSSEVRTAWVRFNQAQEARDIWEHDIVPSLEAEQRQAETAYQSGELALLSVLDVNRRLVDARLRALEAAVAVERASVTLDRSVGRLCVGT
jgi:cobalt-zinc-cadmium efflux system outer membrane protein